MRGLLTILFLLISFLCFSQLSLGYVENWVKSCGIKTELESWEKLFVINGVPFGDEELENELQEFDKNNPWYIDYLISDSVETTFLKPNLLIVLVGNTSKLKKTERTGKLEEVRAKFTDNYKIQYNLHPNPNDPVLIINKHVVIPEEAKEKIEELNPRDIRYIQYVNHTSYALYGRNAKNGAVTILTK